ncbi:histidine kinase, partial [Candidatus Babeliales bacterium]|nr:histidine kinase [Candidatus Babeliales bacterium]
LLAEKPVDLLTIQREIDERFEMYFKYRSEIEGIVFFLRDGRYYYQAGHLGDLSYLVLDDAAIRAQTWYLRAMANRGRTFVLDSFEGLTVATPGQQYISIVQSPVLSSSTTGIDLVYLSFYSRTLTEQIKKESAFANECNLIVNGDDRVILSPNPEHLGLSSDDLGLGLQSPENLNRDYYLIVDNSPKRLVTVYPIERAGWKILNVLDYNMITREIRTYNRYSQLTFLLVLLLFLTFTILNWRDLINPMRKLMDKMTNVGKGDSSVEETTSRIVEIQQLDVAFHKMLTRVDILTRETVEAEIQSLQFQINPHFLLNTLNSIRLMAVISKVENVALMTESLMKIMASTLKSTSSLTTMASEMENLSHFIHIMRIRFGSSFDVDFDIPDDLQGLFVLRLILQAIVENSIIHGLQEKHSKGYISIKAFQANNILSLVVQDNGKGMDEYNFRFDFSANGSEHDGIGLMNVHRRIKLNHGKEYGLQIDSKLGEYTRVIYTLPIITEDRCAERDDC